MRIVKCSGCGKQIHKAKTCYLCGNTTGFEPVGEVVIHENATTAYHRIETFFEKKEFDGILPLTDTVLTWMPQCTSMFWVRLLTKNRCSTAFDLICKGIDCEKDPDFLNGFRHSDESERKVYETLQEKIGLVQKVLKKQVEIHEKQCKLETNIMSLQKNMEKELQTRQEKLFTLFSELEETEQKLYALELDCSLIITEYQRGLNAASTIATGVKQDVDNKTECTPEDFYANRIKLKQAELLSTQSKTALDQAKQHPWVTAFQTMTAERNNQVTAIKKEVAATVQYEEYIKQTLGKISQIELRVQRAKNAVENYSFLDAIQLIGRDTFMELLQQVKIGRAHV